VPNTPPESDLLSGLLKANDELVRCVLLRDRHQALLQAAESVRTLLNADWCGIFLRPDSRSDSLALEAQTPDDGSGHKELCQTLHIHDRLETEPSLYEATTQCLTVPLLNRKAKSLGRLAAHRRVPQGATAQSQYFRPNAENIAKILASDLVFLIESMQVFGALHSLMDELDHASTEKELNERVLDTVLDLLDCKCGHLILWKNVSRELVVSASRGSHSLLVGDIVPTPSIIRTVFETGKAVLAEDVRRRPDYYIANSDTLSELAVPLIRLGRRRGVLNAESERAGAFDRRDEEILDHLGQYAALATQVARNQERIRRLVEESIVAAHDPDFLSGLLQTLSDLCGFDTGIIYTADHQQRILRCGATLNCEYVKIDLSRFNFSFTDHSAAAVQVFHTRKRYYSRDPQNDTNIAEVGRRAFDLKAPLLLVPLIFGQTVVGVLGVWNRQGEAITEAIEERLKPLARLAAAAIATMKSIPRLDRPLQPLRDIFRQIQQPIDRDEKVRHLLVFLQTYAGLDRVRMFTFDEDRQTFYGLDCVGMPDVHNFRNHPLSIENPYARSLLDYSVGDPVARLQDRSMFGTDPAAEWLGEDEGLPWSVVPLRLTARLYGYISADNKYTQAKISEAALSYLTFAGVIATQILSDAEKHGGYGVSDSQGVAERVSSAAWPVLALAEEIRSGRDIPEPARRRWERDLSRRMNLVSNTILKGAAYPLAEKPKAGESLMALIRDRVLIFEDDTKGLGIRIATRLADDSCYAFIDKHGIWSALGWLLKNAAERTGRGGVISVELLLSGLAATVTVTDHGPRIADPSTVFQQAGLLRWAHSVVRAHGSDLVVHTSDAFTTFAFSLPRILPGPSGVRVLVVNASADRSAEISSQLRNQLGAIEVFTARNYVEACACLDASDARAVIVYPNIPRLNGELPQLSNGLELVRHLAQQTRCIVVLDPAWQLLEDSAVWADALVVRSPGREDQVATLLRETLASA